LASSSLQLLRHDLPFLNTSTARLIRPHTLSPLVGTRVAEHDVGNHPAAERFSLATHALGAVLALVGMLWLVGRSEGVVASVAYAVYGASLVVLFAASALHHAIPRAGPHGDRLRRLDHVSIYLFIAGTYTPVCLLALPRGVGVPMLVAVWAFGVVGIALKLLRPFTSRWVSIALYVGMGWTAVFGAVPVAQVFPLEGILLLAGGGVVYTLGAFVYAAKRPDPWPESVGSHGVWHLLVLAGAALQFAFIARYVPAG